MATTYSQVLLDRAEAYVSRPLNSRRYDDGLTELGQLYADLTGEPVGKCRQCQYSDFLAVVTAYIREATRFLHPELMADSQYTFAPGYAGEVIADSRYTKKVTAENLTDEDAVALRKLGYEHVIVLKPGQEAAADASQGSQPDFIVERAEKGQVELDLEAEQDAHEATQQALADEQHAHQALAAKYQQAIGSLTVAEGELAKEKQARATAEQQVQGLQTKLATAQQKLSRKTAPASPAPANATDAPASTSAPVVSTSEAAGPTPTAPAPPATPAQGTAGH